jgi:hypothetical protein
MPRAGENSRPRLAHAPGCGIPDAVRELPRSLLTSFAFGLAVVLAAGCGSSSKPATTAVTQPGGGPADDPTCPVLVAGTSVTVEDTDSGAALVFVTTGDAAAVRTRARALADAHNAKHAAMEQPGGAADPHAGHGAHAGGGEPPKKMTMGTMIGAHSTAAVTDVDGGARVIFTAHDPAALQSELRMHAQHLTGGTCEM